MRPRASIASDPQPTVQARQLVHSRLRLRPKNRNVDGIVAVYEEVMARRGLSKAA